MEDFCPTDKFFCTRLKLFFSYEECKDNYIKEKYARCIGCLTGADNENRYIEYLRLQNQKGNPPVLEKTQKEERGRSPKEKLHVLEKSQKRRCYKCKEYKPLDQFYADKSRADHLENRCKKCHNELNREKHARGIRDKRQNPQEIISKLTISFKDNEALLDKLISLAKQHFRSLNNEILWAIDNYIKESEKMK